MAQVRFNVKESIHKNKETLIYLIYNYQGNRLKMSTGETAKPRFWNYEEQRVREIKSYPKQLIKVQNK